MRTVGACVALFAVVLIVVAQTSMGTSAAKKIGLASSTEPFTELYFADQKRVAAATEGDDRHARTQRVSFVIANRESKSVTYRWAVKSAGLLRAVGQVTLVSGEQATVTPTLAIVTGCAFNARGDRVGATRRRITVSLAPVGDAISYWVACRG